MITMRKVLHLLFLCITLNADAALGALFINDGDITPFEFSNEQLAKSPNEKIFIGDMMFRRGNLTPLGFPAAQWTGALLPIEFAPNVVLSKQFLFFNACNAWSVNTPIRCQARNGESNFIWVEEWDGTGRKCDTVNASCSQVGMQSGQQEIYIHESHWGSRYILEHEIGHAIGYLHEHQRIDRGSFVRLFRHNIDPDAVGQFNPVEARIYSQYDFDSIMHYDNCISSIHVSCTSMTPSLWTMVGDSCFRDLVGGTFITRLDEVGVQRAYGGRLASLFEAQSGGSCGTLTYSLSQFAVACPGGECETVGGVIFSKTVTDYEWSCTFLPTRDGPQYCGAIHNKDFMDMRTDSDFPHIRCPVSTLNERWTKCGCSQQTVKAKCLLNSKVARKVLEEMLSNGTEREKAIARGVRSLIKMIEGGRAEAAIEDKIGLLVLKYFSGTKTGGVLEELACYSEIFVGLKRITDSNYQLRWGDFANIAKGMGMAL